MFANFIGETCTGTTSTISLTGAMRGTIIFSKAFNDGDSVSYFIEDGDGIQKCGGIGTYNSIGTITRNDSWTWNGTTYDSSPSGNLVLSGGEHMITVSPMSSTMLDWNSAFTHSELTSGNPHNVTATEVGLGNVDNTSDIDKPISTLTQIALNGKADSLGPDDNYVTDAEKAQLSNLKGDLNVHTAAIALNTAKVTNATHTGEVTGSSDLTLQPSAITNKPALTTGLLNTDEMLISDGGVLKRVDLSVLKAYNNTGVNATQLSGYSLSSSGDRFNVIPYVDAAGSMEIGKRLDFHDTDGDTTDYLVKMIAFGSGLFLYNNFVMLNPGASETSLAIRGESKATLILAGDTSDTGDSGEADSRIIFSTDGSVDSTPDHGYEFAMLNQSGNSEFLFTGYTNGTPTDIMKFQTTGDVEFLEGSVHKKFCMGDVTTPIGTQTTSLLSGSPTTNSNADAINTLILQLVNTGILKLF